MTGNDDGDSAKSIPDRLKALRNMQRSWETPEVKLAGSMDIPSRDWSHARWQKDVFFGRYPFDKSLLDVFYCSSAFKGENRLQHLQFDVVFDGYCVDFDQDLIALARTSVADET